MGGYRKQRIISAFLVKFEVFFKMESMLEGLKMFDKWPIDNISVEDEGLKEYINLNPVIVPKTGGKHAGQTFHKSKISIVERLINRVMVAGHKGKKHKISSGHMTGKAVNAYNVVKEALEIVEKKTGKNPVAVLVKAIENAATREEVVTIQYGGARYTKAVECAPQRRVDLVLRFFTQGAYTKSFNSKRKIAPVLAEEILAAFNASPSSFAISKKVELERQADSSR